VLQHCVEQVCQRQAGRFVLVRVVLMLFVGEVLALFDSKASAAREEHRDVGRVVAAGVAVVDCAASVPPLNRVFSTGRR
jgi:hypothetical protein